MKGEWRWASEYGVTLSDLICLTAPLLTYSGVNKIKYREFTSLQKMQDENNKENDITVFVAITSYILRFCA